MSGWLFLGFFQSIESSAIAQSVNSQGKLPSISSPVSDPNNFFFKRIESSSDLRKLYLSVFGKCIRDKKAKLLTKGQLDKTNTNGNFENPEWSTHVGTLSYRQLEFDEKKKNQIAISLWLSDASALSFQLILYFCFFSFSIHPTFYQDTYYCRVASCFLGMAYA